MFKLVEELWKSQHYIQEQNDFLIPDTIYFSNQEIQWYFSSVNEKHKNRILKKKNEHATLQHIISGFGVTEQYKSVQAQDINRQKLISLFDNERLVATLFRFASEEQQTINVTHLTKLELARFLYDYKNYPNLYQETILRRLVEADQEYKNHTIQVTLKSGRIQVDLKKYQSIVTFEDANALFEGDKINQYREKRIQNICCSIIKRIEILQLNQQKVVEAVLYFLCSNKEIVLEQCSLLRLVNTKNQNRVFNLKYKSRKDYLQNQPLIEENQKALLQDQIKQQQYLAEQKIQCSCCCKLVIKSETSEVLCNKLWQIRLKLNLHSLNQNKLIINGKTIGKRNPYGFANVCSQCYEVFLVLVSEQQSEQQVQKYNRQRLISISFDQPKPKEDKERLFKQNNQKQEKQIPVEPMKPKCSAQQYSTNSQSIQDLPIRKFSQTREDQRTNQALQILTNDKFTIKNYASEQSKSQDQKSVKFEKIEQISLLDDFENLLIQLKVEPDVDDIPKSSIMESQSQQRARPQSSIIYQTTKKPELRHQTNSKPPIHPYKHPTINDCYNFNELSEILDKDLINYSQQTCETDKQKKIIYKSVPASVKQSRATRKARSFSAQTKPQLVRHKNDKEEIESIVNSQINSMLSQNRGYLIDIV